MIIIEDPIVTVICRTAIKALFLFFNSARGSFMLIIRYELCSLLKTLL
jgi:hypothetical protein